MLINTVPDDCLMYIGFQFILIFNITSIVNVFVLSIEKIFFFIQVDHKYHKYYFLQAL